MSMMGLADRGMVREEVNEIRSIEDLGVLGTLHESFERERHLSLWREDGKHVEGPNHG